MRVLVTGGAGFIGSHVSGKLLTDGHAVTILDDLNDFYDPNLKCSNIQPLLVRGASFRCVDIRSCNSVERVFETEEFDVVIHLAARAGVRPSIQEPQLYLDTNVTGTLNVLEAMRKHGTRKLVFASSSSVYGLHNRTAFQETDYTGRPLSPYAASKLAGENLAFTYSHLFGISAVCLRLFTVYGPRQRPDLAISRFFHMLTAGRPIPMFGDGSTSRDYTYVDDVVQGICASLQLASSYEVINLGSSSPILLRDVIRTLADITGLDPVIDLQPEQPGDVQQTYADITKAATLLGYEPSVSFTQGLRRMYEWYQSAPVAPLRPASAWAGMTGENAGAGLQ